MAMPSPMHHATSTNTYNFAAISVHPPVHSSAMADTSNRVNLTSLPALLPDVSAISPNYESVTLLHRINQLESLLAGSEIDNRNLNEKLELLNAAKNRQRMELQEEIKQRELEIDKLQEDLNLTELRDSKNTKKLAAVENYIVTLPSEEELRDLQAKVDKLTAENDYLNSRLGTVKRDLNKTQMEMIQKERELQGALTK
jgi:chromosome segregation ATPase